VGGEARPDRWLLGISRFPPSQVITATSWDFSTAIKQCKVICFLGFYIPITRKTDLGRLRQIV